jgi:predicted transcriptional regulator
MLTRRALAQGLLAVSFFGLLVGGLDAIAASVGQKVSNPELRDANDKPAKIPDIGSKVVAVFYSDPDVSDMNDAFADKLKAANLDKAKYRGVGVANLKETWLPDEVIRSVVRKKIEKYGATILTDPDRVLATAWGLGDCNEQSVVIILDKTATVQYVKKGKMNATEIESGYQLVVKLMEQ